MCYPFGYPIFMTLTRSNEDKLLAGVCGGIAGYLGWDATLIRVIYALLTVFSAAFPGILVYLILWLLMPPDPRVPRLSNLELE